jgi:hypothetical protein
MATCMRIHVQKGEKERQRGAKITSFDDMNEEKFSVSRLARHPFLITPTA